MPHSIDDCGQTVNIAVRVQDLEVSRPVFAVEPFVANPTSPLLDAVALTPPICSLTCYSDHNWTIPVRTP